MALRQLIGRIISTKTGHFAARIGWDKWRVSWLPSDSLTRHKAITAMELAETLSHQISKGSPEWEATRVQARELNVTAKDAQQRIKEPLQNWPQRKLRPREPNPRLGPLHDRRRQHDLEAGA